MKCKNFIGNQSSQLITRVTVKTMLQAASVLMTQNIAGTEV